MKKANIIVLAGQSNAVGVGFTKYLSEHFDKTTADRFYEGYEKVKINYVSHDIRSNGFVKTAVNCTERSKDTLGPEVGIAKKLTEKYPNEEFFIVKCAFGGSDMQCGWRSPSSGVPYRADMQVDPAKAIASPEFRPEGWCYHELIGVLSDSIGQLKRDGREPTVIAFCWMQGESDAGNPEAAAAYAFRYECMLKDLRETFAPYFDKCSYIDAGISEIWKDYDKMNATKKAYAEEHHYSYLDTVAAGLTTRKEPKEAPDIAHYDTDCVVKLGEMFAEKIEIEA